MNAKDLARRVYTHPVMYAGSRFECPICEGRFRRLIHGRGRQNVQCPRCGSYERMRALWLFLRDEIRLPQASNLRVLHFAPERSISARLRGRTGLDYVTADIEPGVAMETIDITSIQHPAESFDLVICSHVLEHVAEDRAAMAELYRILRPGGNAYLMQPVDFERSETYEDFTIVSPEARARAFNQHNHVRIYGRDIRDRLEGAGFEVTERRYTEEIDPTLRARAALQDGDATIREDVIFVARKPLASAAAA